MIRVGIDTSVLLRVSNPDDVRHELAVKALSRLKHEGKELVIVPQVLAEFWVVATRPTEVNGLGASAAAVSAEIDRLLRFFELTPEPREAFAIWKKLVSTIPVLGRRAHDARLVAAYSASGCDLILTLDPKDFAGLLGPANLSLAEV